MLLFQNLRQYNTNTAAWTAFIFSPLSTMVKSYAATNLSGSMKCPRGGSSSSVLNLVYNSKAYKKIGSQRMTIISLFFFKELCFIGPANQCLKSRFYSLHSGRYNVFSVHVETKTGSLTRSAYRHLLTTFVSLTLFSRCPMAESSQGTCHHRRLWEREHIATCFSPTSRSTSCSKGTLRFFRGDRSSIWPHLPARTNWAHRSHSTFLLLILDPYFPFKL